MRARLPHRLPGTQRGPGSALRLLSRPDPSCQTVTDQVADVGQVLVGEDGLPIQVGDVEEAAEHGSRYYIAQYWSLLVDVAHTQRGALATAHGELLPGGPCQGRVSSLEQLVEGRREVGLQGLRWPLLLTLAWGLPVPHPRKEGAYRLGPRTGPGGGPT